MYIFHLLFIKKHYYAFLKILFLILKHLLFPFMQKKTALILLSKNIRNLLTKKKVILYSLRININKNGDLFIKNGKPCTSCSKLIYKYKHLFSNIIYSQPNYLVQEKDFKKLISTSKYMHSQFNPRQK